MPKHAANKEPNLALQLLYQSGLTISIMIGTILYNSHRQARWSLHLYLLIFGLFMTYYIYYGWIRRNFTVFGRSWDSKSYFTTTGAKAVAWSSFFMLVIAGFMYISLTHI